jgi:hypothetical protein
MPYATAASLSARNQADLALDSAALIEKAAEKIFLRAVKKPQQIR